MNNEKIIKLPRQVEELSEQMDSIELKSISELTFEHFGAKGDGITDDTKEVQDAINYCSVNKIKIKMQGKVYVVSNITIHPYTVISGCGIDKSYFKAKSGSSGDMILLGNNASEFAHLTGFTVEGMRSTTSYNSLINISKTESLGDNFTTIENIKVTHSPKHGIQIGTYARELRLTNILICYNDGIGLNIIGGSDNFYQFITLSYNQLGGVYFGGSASRMISCKSFNSGIGTLDGVVKESYGFLVRGIAQTLVACESQENGGHGFILDSLKDSSLSDLRADRNGMYDNTLTPKVLTHAGMYLKGSLSNVSLTGTCNDYKKSQGFDVTQGYGIICEALAESYINVNIKNNNEPYSFTQNYVLSNGVNQININGRNISRSYQKSIVVDRDDVDGSSFVELGKSDDSVKWRICRDKTNNHFRIDKYELGQWRATPFVISTDNSTKIGATDGKLGFFGSWGTTKKTALANATDLDSAIALVNNLKGLLKLYGLID